MREGMRKAPCPFCGNGKAFGISTTLHEMIGDRPFYLCTVKCLYCGARVSQGGFTPEEARANAWKRWNIKGIRYDGGSAGEEPEEEVYEPGSELGGKRKKRGADTSGDSGYECYKKILTVCAFLLIGQLFLIIGKAVLELLIK